MFAGNGALQSKPIQLTIILGFRGMIFQVAVHGGVISWESHGDIIDLLGPHLVNGFYPQFYMDFPLLHIYIYYIIYYI